MPMVTVGQENGADIEITLRGTLVSDQAWQASWNLAVSASAAAAVASSRRPEAPGMNGSYRTSGTGKIS